MWYGDDSKLSAEGHESTCYTVLQNTSSANLYATVEISQRYGDTWYQTGSKYNTDTCLSANEVVATPAMNRNTSSTIYKYVHSAEALNYQNHSVVEDKLTYRVDQAN